MKHTSYLLLIILLLGAKHGYSQTTVGSRSATISFVYGSPKSKITIDTAKLVVQYTYLHIGDTLRKTIWKDSYRLEIGHRFSKYYSIFADKADSNMFLFTNSKAAKKIDAAINPYKFLQDNETADHDIYWRDLQTDSLLVSNIIVNTRYASREPVPDFAWEIFPDTLYVLGYRCQLAKTKFRGRNYSAWFSFDIPISSGPWKFSGLPGLILKVQTDCKYFTMEAVGVRVPNNIHPIHGEKNPFRYITHKEMLKLYKMSYADPAGLVIQHGLQYAGTDGNGPYRIMQSGDKTFPYVPFLELE